MRVPCVAFVAVCIAVLGVVTAAAQQPVTAFENVAVIPMDRERVLQGQTVVVQGDRIVAMGPAKQVRVPTAAMRVDGRGKFLMPGLTDMHMHLGIPGSGYAERILFLLLANGITTIRDVDYLNIPGFILRSTVPVEAEELLRLRAGVAAGTLLGPRIYTAGEWYTDTSKSVAANVDAYKAAGYDFIKVHDEPAGPWLDSLVDAARRVGMPIVGHPVGGLAYALEHRFASVEHLIGFPLGASDSNGLADTVKIPESVAKTVQAGTRVTPTLAWVSAGDGVKMDPHYLRGQRYIPAKYRDFYGYLGRVDTTASGASKARDTLPSKVAAVREVRRQLIMALQRAGVELLAGTDSPFLVPGYGVHQELESLVRLGGLTPYQALLTSTRNVASYFGTLDSTGTIGVGKRADLVLLSANPLTDIRHTERIAGVMAAGRWISAAEIERRLTAYAKDSGKD